MRNVLFGLIVLLSADIAMATIFPPWFGGGRDRDRTEEQEVQLPDTNVSELLIRAELEMAAKLDVEPQCSNPRGNAFFTHRKRGFSNVTSVQNWCYNFFDQYGIERSFDNLVLFCDWDRFGSFGNYSWDAIFIFVVEFYGSPQFEFATYCGDSGGGGGGGSGGY